MFTCLVCKSVERSAAALHLHQFGQHSTEELSLALLWNQSLLFPIPSQVSNGDEDLLLYSLGRYPQFLSPPALHQTIPCNIRSNEVLFNTSSRTHDKTNYLTPVQTKFKPEYYTHKKRHYRFMFFDTHVENDFCDTETLHKCVETCRVLQTIKNEAEVKMAMFSPPSTAVTSTIVEDKSDMSVYTNVNGPEIARRYETPQHTCSSWAYQTKSENGYDISPKNLTPTPSDNGQNQMSTVRNHVLMPFNHIPHNRNALPNRQQVTKPLTNGEMLQNALSPKNDEMAVSSSTPNTEEYYYSCNERQRGKLCYASAHDENQTGDMCMSPKYRFSCNLCPGSYQKKAHLTRHLRSHTGERPFTCEVCGNKFRTKSVLKQHLRIHSGEKPYVCYICNARFPQSSGLSTHMMLHTGKPFKCNRCPKSFVSNFKLINHCKTHEKKI